jgi:hypothetical protein
MNTSFKILANFVLAAFALASSPTALAHRSGCHGAHSCPSDTGSYVCGDKGNSSQCGNSVAPSATPKKSKDESRTKSKRPQRPTTTADNPFLN